MFKMIMTIKEQIIMAMEKQITTAMEKQMNKFEENNRVLTMNNTVESL